MMLPIRTLSATDAEVMARTVVSRTSVKGRVECHGLTWRSDSLLEWEIRQREKGEEPKVDVRIDELDLHVVYIDVPERGVGPFRGLSRQPEFTRGLSLFELRRLKRAIKDKELSDRLGRMEDQEAMRLRVEFHALLGHGNDPAAQKRLSDLQDQMALLRLQQACIDQSPDCAPIETPGARAASKSKRTRSRPRTSGGRSDDAIPTPPANEVPTIPNPSVLAPTDSNAADSTRSNRKSGDLPTRKLSSIKINRRHP